MFMFIVFYTKSEQKASFNFTNPTNIKGIALAAIVMLALTFAAYYCFYIVTHYKNIK